MSSQKDRQTRDRHQNLHSPMIASSTPTRSRHWITRSSIHAQTRRRTANSITSLWTRQFTSRSLPSRFHASARAISNITSATIYTATVVNTVGSISSSWTAYKSEKWLIEWIGVCMMALLSVHVVPVHPAVQLQVSGDEQLPLLAHDGEQMARQWNKSKIITITVTSRSTELIYRGKMVVV